MAGQRLYMERHPGSLKAKYSPQAYAIGIGALARAEGPHKGQSKKREKDHIKADNKRENNE